MPPLTLLLFFVILVEGYVVLSSELIAIRQTMPFVGSGAETVAIIISAVLLPLAFGYHRGGQAYQREFKRRGAFSIRRRLIRNITIASAFLTFGLSYLLVEIYFMAFNAAGIENRILQIALYAAIFLVTPTYLLGQTVPLIANYFRKNRMAEAAGKILFVSTAGSFFGAIESSLIMMPWLGVGMTIAWNILFLAVIAWLLCPRRLYIRLIPIACITLLAFTMNGKSMLSRHGILRDNQYNTIRIYDVPAEQSRIMELNRTGASKYAENDEFLFPYIYYLEKNFVEPLAGQGEEGAKKDILVIGAGGFVLGLDDGINHYTFVDIDDDLLEVSEEHLLKQELTDNKDFYPEPARGFLARDTNRYDLIILDVYTNIHSVPPQLMTVEFLSELKTRLKEQGVLAANIATTANFSERFSVLFDNTFRSIFPNYTRQVIQDYDPWKTDNRDYQNVLYIYYNRDYSDAIYTDNRNTLAYDRSLKSAED